MSDLGNAFMLKSGLKDRKGNHTYFPEPVNKWLKRKVLVEKKMESSVVTGAKKQKG